MIHKDCEMKDELTKAVEGIKTQNRWFMGILGGAIILLLVGYGSQQTQQINLKDSVTKINRDYTPLEVVQDLIENTDKYISIVQTISNSAKDDARYHEAIDNRNKFQSEALRRISMGKRSGGGSATGSGSSQ